MNRFVWTDSQGRFAPLSSRPHLGDGTGNGAFFWDSAASMMWVKLTGGKNLQVSRLAQVVGQ